MKKILISIDDGPHFEKVAKSGFLLGKQLNADVAIVSVVDITALMTDGGITPRELADTIINDFKKSHQLLIENVFENLTIQSFIEEGKITDQILKVANEWQADIIVLGTHGRKGLSHLIMGSISEQVIRQTSKPVFVIPTRHV